MKHRKQYIQRPINSFFFAMIPVLDRLEEVVRASNAKRATERAANKPKTLNLIGA